MYDCWVERDRLRIVMSSIMRRRRGLIVALGDYCREGGGCDDPHPLRQETLDQQLSSGRARRYSRAAGSFNPCSHETLDANCGNFLPKMRPPPETVSCTSTRSSPVDADRE